MLHRSLLLFSLLLATVSAGGVKGVAKPTNRARRLKKSLKGPKERSCDVDSKRDEVKFECKSRSGRKLSDGESSSKDDKEYEKSSSADPAASTDSVDEPTTRGMYVTSLADVKDEIKYKIKTTRDGISVQLEYKNEIQMNATSDTETKTKFQLLFQELVEYVKAPNADSEAYDWEQDEIVQSIPLTEWADIPGVTDDGVVAYFTATASNYLEGGSAEFKFTISRAEQGERVTANSMKIDVRILDFPWTRSDSYLALLSTLESKKKVKVEYDTEAQVSKGGKKAKDVSVSFGEDMEDTFGFSTYGQYTWVEEAEAAGGMTTDANNYDGSTFNGTVMTGRQGSESQNVIMVENTTSTIQVIATSPATSTDEETVQQIAYSFVGSGAQGASDIYWDPEAGIGYSSGVGRAGFFIGLVGTAIVALFSLLA